ncbi:hypothetical protein ACJX0J_034222, partial [Zea mays]
MRRDYITEADSINEDEDDDDNANGFGGTHPFICRAPSRTVTGGCLHGKLFCLRLVSGQASILSWSPVLTLEARGVAGAPLGCHGGEAYLGEQSKLSVCLHWHGGGCGSRGTTPLLFHGEPRTVLPSYGGQPGIQLAPGCSIDDDDPLALCKELNEKNNVTKKVLRGGLICLLTVHQKLM